jgi:hypothetical protein
MFGEWTFFFVFLGLVQFLAIPPVYNASADALPVGFSRIDIASLLAPQGGKFCFCLDTP